MEKEIILKDEVFAVIGAAIEVHKELGPGFLEAIYQEALEMELVTRKIPFVAQQIVSVLYKGAVLKKSYLTDLVCFDQILVELKALDKLSSRDEAQILNYLKATGLRVGLLINFGSQGKLEWMRYVR